MLLSFENGHDFGCDSDDELLLPSYDEAFERKDAFAAATDFLQQPALQKREFDEESCEPPESSDFQYEDSVHPSLPKDDTCILQKPSHNVDYLSQQWSMDEFWASRRIVLKGDIGHLPRARLSNTLWRSWAKTFHKLPIACPESIAWQRDSDITWLYGPIVPSARPAQTHTYLVSEMHPLPSDPLRRSILKKRTEVHDLLPAAMRAPPKTVSFCLTYIHCVSP